MDLKFRHTWFVLSRATSSPKWFPNTYFGFLQQPPPRRLISRWLVFRSAPKPGVKLGERGRGTNIAHSIEDLLFYSFVIRINIIECSPATCGCTEITDATLFTSVHMIVIFDTDHSCTRIAMTWAASIERITRNFHWKCIIY